MIEVINNMRELMGDGWFAGYVLLGCFLVFRVITKRIRWVKEKFHLSGLVPLFPDRVFYYGEVYERSRIAEKDIFKYFYGYGLVVFIMGGLEYIVEGAPGQLVHIEIVGFYGSLLGCAVFAGIGEIVGAILTINAIRKGEDKKTSADNIIDEYFNKASHNFMFLGALLGIMYAHYHMAVYYALELWKVVAVTIIPTLIVFFGFSRRFLQLRRSENFFFKSQKREKDAVSKYVYVKPEKALPDVVISRDPKAEELVNSLRDRFPPQ